MIPKHQLWANALVSAFRAAADLSAPLLTIGAVHLRLLANASANCIVERLIIRALLDFVAETDAQIV